MPVSKLKNLAILILLLANIVLLCLLVPRQAERRKQEQQLRSSLSSLCAGQNVALQADVLPDTVTLYELELADTHSAEDNALAAVLGEAPNREEGQLQSGQELRSGSWEDGRLFLKLQAQKPVSDLRGASKKTLRKMDFQYHSLGQPVRLSPGIYSITAQQSVLGMPIFSDGLTFTYSNSALSELQGTFFAGSLTRTDNTPCISAAQAVVAFLSARVELGWVGSTVTGLEQGYVPSVASGTVRLTPAWMLSTDTGSYLVDGLTQQVSIVE
ncbi:MAG: hypothetical protein J6J43_06690 [Oscillospiraceae bacterium]|nr:hypothetical protein [Oscillospiraceae bacterium]